MCSHCAGDYEDPDTTEPVCECGHPVSIHDSVGCQVGLGKRTQCRCRVPVETLRELIAEGKVCPVYRPEVFPTDGPKSQRWTAYDPGRYDQCGDPDCGCRRSKGNIRGFGSTPNEALEDYWEQIKG